jgi:hypothetical protein
VTAPIWWLISLQTLRRGARTGECVGWHSWRSFPFFFGITVVLPATLPRAYEIHVCPKAQGDLTLWFDRFAVQTKQERVSQDLYARDFSDRPENSVFRVIEKKVLVTSIERVLGSDGTTVFIRFYIAPSVDTALDRELRRAVTSDDMGAVVAAMGREAEASFSC